MAQPAPKNTVPRSICTSGLSFDPSKKIEHYYKLFFSIANVQQIKAAYMHLTKVWLSTFVSNKLVAVNLLTFCLIYIKLSTVVLHGLKRDDGTF
jgi:hypothetical protein